MRLYHLMGISYEYQFIPLTCTRCQGSMRVIAFIGNEDVIKKILKHLGLWVIKRKPIPVANVYPPRRAPPIIPDSYPIPTVDDYVIDPDYPVATYL
ncbi:hypothetical protein ACFL0M_15385 [Thermodesulfobacteriota bacterium]